MTQKIIQAGNLICYHKATARCSLYLCFPFQENIHLDHIHLLEHMMIGGFLQAHTETKKHEGVIESLNGISNGFSLTFFAKNHYKVARQTAVMMVDFLMHEFTLSQEDIKAEQRIIAIEDEYYNISDIDRFNNTFTSFGEEKKASHHPSERYQDLYQKIFKQQKPLIIFQGDFEQPEIMAAYTYLKHHLRVIKGSPFDSNISVNKELFTTSSYTPIREPFKAGYLKKAGLFLSTPLHLISSISTQWLLIFFINHCLLEFIRYGEKTDYDVSCTPRILTNSRQCSWTFLTTGASRDIVMMLGEMFIKDAEQFELIKKQISYEILQREDDHYQTYFSLVQHILIGKGVRTIEDLVSKLMNISYDTFRDFYEENLEYISVRELEKID